MGRKMVSGAEREGQQGVMGANLGRGCVCADVDSHAATTRTASAGN